MEINVDHIQFKNGKTLKVGDTITPKDEYYFRRVYGGAYGGGAYNSRPEIDYKFKNRLGRENEIVEIINEDGRGDLNEYSYYKFLLVLKTKRSRINMLISLNNCEIDEYLKEE